MAQINAPTDLFWLKKHQDLPDAIGTLRDLSFGDAAGVELARVLSLHQMSFLEEKKLDRIVQSHLEAAPGFEHEKLKRIKLAILADSTFDHLVASLRVAGLRRGFIIDCYVAPYGQIQQQVFSPTSELKDFDPDVVLISRNTAGLVSALTPGLSGEDVDAMAASHVEELSKVWQALKSELGVTVVQQTGAPIAPTLYGSYDRHVASSPRTFVEKYNDELWRAAAETGCLLFDMDQLYAKYGIVNMFNPMLWNHAKQETAPAAAPIWADYCVRTLQAAYGLSKKCLVLDLDNTLWGGIIGDDGLQGISLGMGSAVGEAFWAFQNYAKQLNQRGILLAICSKNTYEVAAEAINAHPEMVLKESDFSVIKANWQPKPDNIAEIAQELNIGLDSLVFFDDNPMERDHVRQALPMVCVPEVPQDPAHYVNCLESAGYFETVSLTADDLVRASQYKANKERAKVEQSADNMEAYLSSLGMELSISPFVPIDMQRITQLVNKTNQFNVTTKRYQQAELDHLADNEDVLTISARLKDKFGDNGLISVVIAKHGEYAGGPALIIDTWLMSCRVLGRMVEHELFNHVLDYARRKNMEVVVGEYIPTERNAMVSDLFLRFGFAAEGESVGVNKTKTSETFVLKIDANVAALDTPINVSVS
ncbi:HAD-IIIC family phosphatase [Magnetovibrio sp. PR-2]|uniref:HAD-IIIC family phosphatase n=1 Tax=Magnetovibrio sp. PR-2 TaxID=3120356 RepID=UPI002FCE119A